MINEEKQLLLKDLCARLPYGVICNLYDVEDTNKKFQLKELSNLIISAINSGCIKPYLRPMSSMTDKDMDELNKYVGGDRFIFENGVISVDENFYQEGHLYSDHEDYVDIIDWLNEHHFDYRGLIEKGLALEAPEGMYKTE